MTIQEDGQNRNEVSGRSGQGFVASQLMRHEAWDELFDLESGNSRRVSHNRHKTLLNFMIMSYSTWLMFVLFMNFPSGPIKTVRNVKFFDLVNVLPHAYD